MTPSGAYRSTSEALLSWPFSRAVSGIAPVANDTRLSTERYSLAKEVTLFAMRWKTSRKSLVLDGTHW
ncbi:unnamed protein product [Thlaspi arvense]|uniref:Uncharacterized protein n=1 Tax=Thlaspi arvense TaxID=13288 RepID=A0AAU9RP42_THLAR|nr:unnamed protein product [Thlaspi arvense]